MEARLMDNNFILQNNIILNNSYEELLQINNPAMSK